MPGDVSARVRIDLGQQWAAELDRYTAVLGRLHKTMDNDKKWEGYWWLPGNESQSVPGTLTYAESRIVLETLGPLTEGWARTGGTIDAIVGVSAEGKNITLVNCRSQGGRMSFPGIERQKYSARLLAVNVHLASEDELTLGQFSFRCTDLSVWVGRSGFSVESNYSDRSYQINYQLPEPIEAAILDGMTFTVDFSAEGPSGEWLAKSMTISETEWMCISTQEELPFMQLYKTATRIRDFLTLAIGRPVFITHMLGRSDRARVNTNEHGSYYRDIELYPAHQAHTSSRHSVWSPEKVLLPLADVEPRLGGILSSWVERAVLLEPVMDLYFGTLYEPTVHLQRHFLLLSQAIETYHRRTSDATDLPEPQHTARMNAVLDSVPSEYRIWLRQRLHYSNELSLRQRIKDLVQWFQPILSGFIETKAFVNVVVDTRNYLTHYDPTLKAKAATDLDLLDLIYKLRTLLEICFLREVGLDDDIINRVMAKQIEERSYIVAVNRPKSA